MPCERLVFSSRVPMTSRHGLDLNSKAVTPRGRSIRALVSLALFAVAVYGWSQRDGIRAGRVDVTFTIGLTGKVLLAKAAKGGSAADAEFATCVERSWTALPVSRRRRRRPGSEN